MSRFSTGKNAKAISDRSGMAFPYKEMVKEWNGAFVHQSEFESKHPQLEPRTHLGDAEGLQNARPARTEPPVPQILTANSLAAGAVDSILVNVNLPGHGYSTGNRLRFRGVESHFPIYPQVARIDDDNINDARGHVLTKIDDENFSFSPNDLVENFLTDNCVPGTTTVYVDLDGTLTEYYQAIAVYATGAGFLAPGGDWYNMSPIIEAQAAAQVESQLEAEAVNREKAHVDMMMKQVLTPDARSRLANLSLVDESTAMKVKTHLILWTQICFIFPMKEAFWRIPLRSLKKRCGCGPSRRKRHLMRLHT